MRRLKHRWSALAVPLALCAACAPEIPQSAKPKVVVAVFDPLGSPPSVPLPNNLALNPETGLLNIPKEAPGTPPAQFELNTYLRTLDGFPTSTPITASFSEDVSQTSAEKPGAIVLFDLGDMKTFGSADFKATVTGKKLTVVPTKQWSLGHTYGVAVFGGADPDGIQGADGSPVVADRFTFFLRSTDPLLTQFNKDGAREACPIDEKTKSYVETCRPALGLSFAQAKLLEGLRQKTDPLLSMKPGPLDAVNGGMPRDRHNIVLFWTFSIATGPFAVFDPTAGKVPFPNEALKDQATGKVNLPAGALPEAIRMGLNQLDGFSTSGHLTVNIDTVDGAPFKGAKPGETVLLVDAASPFKPPAFAAGPQLANGGKDYTGLMQINPERPLTGDKSLYVALLTTGITDSRGEHLKSSPVMQLIKLRSPLADKETGKSNVSVLTDDLAVRLEVLRAQFDNPDNNLWDKLKLVSGYTRDDTAIVWVFRTQSMTQTLTDLAALPGKKSLPTDVTILDVQAPGGTILGQPAPDVGSLVFGKLHTYLALDKTTGTLDVDKGTATDIPFLMSLPTAAKTPVNGAPVVILQHGLFGWRGSVRPIMQAFAAKGWATIAIDINFHGGRAICTSNAQCQGGTCTAGVCTGKQVTVCTADLDCKAPGTCNKMTGACTTELAANSNQCMTHQEGAASVTECLSTASGAGFTNFGNLFATRDNFRQHVVDLAQLQRVVAVGDLKAKLIAKSAALRIDGSKVHFVGQSLGGITGTLYMAASPDAKVGVLNVPGGRLVDIIANSQAFGYLLDPILKSFNITKDTKEYFQLANTLRWILDPGDPINYARMLSAKKVMVQQAGMDMTIPAVYTEGLAVEIGLPMVNKHIGVTADRPVSTFFPDAAHGFLFASPPGKGTATGQLQTTTWISSDGTLATDP